MIESAMSVSSLRFLPGVRALILSGFFACHSVSAGVPQADYDAVIQATRGEQSSAQLAPAIDQLRAWHLANPEDMRFLYDLAALLDRAGDYPAALLHYPQIVKADAPPYAIKAVAHAAKMANRPQQAKRPINCWSIKRQKIGKPMLVWCTPGSSKSACNRPSIMHRASCLTQSKNIQRPTSR